jgi:hypothetical protein
VSIGAFKEELAWFLEERGRSFGRGISKGAFRGTLAFSASARVGFFVFVIYPQSRAVSFHSFSSGRLNKDFSLLFNDDEKSK